MLSTVFVKIQTGREWVLRIERVPLTAARSRDCKAEFVQQRSGGATLTVGDVLVECLRNNRGVQTVIVLPNGYCLPTGRIAPKESWFPMLKSHLRSWLAMAPAGRIVRITNEGTKALEAQMAAGKLSEDTYRRASAKLEQYRADAMGELPSKASESDLLAGFYNWVTEVSGQTGLSQQDVVAIVDRALRTGKKIQVPDLDEEVLDRDFKRFLDI